MTTQDELNSTLSDFYAFINSRYADHSYLQDDFETFVAGTSLSSPQKADLIDKFDTQQPLASWFGPTEVTAINQAVADATMAGGAAYLKQLANSYPSLGTSILSNVEPNKSLFEVLDSSLVELGTASNQNFPEIASTGKAITAWATTLALAFGVSQVYHSADPEAEGIKQGVLAGTSLLAAEVIGGFFAGTVGLPVTIAAAIGSLGAGLIAYALEKHWDNIVSDVTTAKGLSTSLEDTQTAIDGTYGATLQSDMEDQGGTNITQMLAHGQSLLDELSGTLEMLPDYALPSPIYLGIQPAFATAITAGSPLVIDLSSGHSGVTLTTWNAATTTTYFDLNATGFAVQTAWVSGDTGLLARDLNSNGTIDSSAELFGSPTIDGFAKLAVLDSNHDLRIDNNDADWSTLVVWTDTNGDAVTQSGELHSLASLNIESIDLASVTASTSTISGNAVSHISTVRFTGGATAAIDDVWFKHDNTNSYYTGDYTLDADTLVLPTLRGYGTLPDLTIAMSLDGDLKDLVADFVGNFSLDSFADAVILKSDIEAILFKWAGVDGVDPDSRGDYVDARHLEFLEHLVGADFFNVTLQTSNPTPGPMVTLGPAYQTAFDMFAAALFAQTSAATLFADPIQYNPYTGEVEGSAVLSSTTLDYLASVAPAPGAVNDAMWVMIVRYIESIEGIDNLTGTEQTWLEDAIEETDSNLSINTVRHIIDPTFGEYTYSSGTSGNDTLNGGGDKDYIGAGDGNDTVHGNGANDTIYGEAGNDTLYGDGGNDLIYGGIGNDTIYGGDGDDTIYADQGTNVINGGEGANYLRAGSDGDIYVYGGGQDLIYDQGGTDEIQLASGITFGDLSFTRVSSQGSLSSFNDLLISVDGYESIQIQNQYNGAYTATETIETIRFADNSTLNLTTIATPEFYLTSGNDGLSYYTSSDVVVHGQDGNDTITLSGGGNNTFDGGAGNDSLSGGSGNDTYIAGPGIDTISESGGSDTIVIPAGYDADDITFYRVLGLYGPTNDLGIVVAGLGEIIVQGQLNGWSYPVVENLHFLEDNSTLSLTGISITTVGTSGNDSLYAPSGGASANDIIDGREGNDYLAAGSGDDTYVFSAGHDTIYDDGGNDTIAVRSSYAPGDVTIEWNYDVNNYTNNRGFILTDTDGNTVVVQNQSYSSSFGIEHIVFADSTTWDLSSMELELHGTSSADSLDGRDVGDASSADTIYGLGGNDTINGNNGDDLIYGGDGNDYLLGNSGNDTIHGGDGADIIYAASNDGNDVMYGEGGDDTLKGADHSILYGGDGDDQLWNIASSPYAATTSVAMYGGAGADTLLGNYGLNYMNGGAGADTMQGSSGVDTFAFSSDAFGSVDTVQYFTKTGADADKIDISDILDGYYDSGTDVITDFVQIATNGSNSELYVDVTGTGTFGSAQHIATIQSVTGLTDEAALVTAGTLLAA